MKQPNRAKRRLYDRQKQAKEQNALNAQAQGHVRGWQQALNELPPDDLTTLAAHAKGFQEAFKRLPQPMPTQEAQNTRASFETALDAICNLIVATADEHAGQEGQGDE